MPRVVHFELMADDPDRAVEFYKKVFEWEITKWNGPEDYWLIKTGEPESPGIDGGLMKRSDGKGFAPVTNTIDVNSVDEYLTSIKVNGGEVFVPKMAIPGVGWMAYCKDTEGNIFGIIQNDPEAK
jgi:uncharacterized protein